VQPPEEPVEKDAAMPLLLGVAGLSIVLGLVVGVVPGLQQRIEAGAERFLDRGAYAAKVLHGVAEPIPPQLPFALPHTTSSGLAYGFGALALTLALTALGLWWQRLPESFLRAAALPLRPVGVTLRAVHSGIIGDYVLWIALGFAVIGGVWGLGLR
jgi:multicomponent Na+:H+ antiporter subunit D